MPTLQTPVNQALSYLFKTKNVKALCWNFFRVHLTYGQEAIVRAVAYDTYPRTIINCMTRYGKSYSVAMGLLLWIMMNPGMPLVLLAPTNEKTGIIRNHMANFIARSPYFTALLDIERGGHDRIRKEVSKKRMTWKNGVEFRTLSTEGEGDALMGFGAKKVVHDETWFTAHEVFRGKVSRMLGDYPDSSYVEIGNPMDKNNHMWEHWIDPTYHKIHIGFEQALQEGRITQAFVDEQRLTLTPREFKILYQAEFPDSSEDALILWEWIDAALKRPAFDIIANEIIMGIDVAEMGNDTTVITIVKRNTQGQYEIIGIHSWERLDVMPTVARILPLIDQYKPLTINVDAIGVGSGAYSRLNELRNEGKFKATVNGLKVGSSPTQKRDKFDYLNLKSQLYWRLRGLFEQGKIRIIQHRVLLDQLNKMKYELTSSEKLRIRDPGTKEGDTAEEKSPDFADSLMMACADHDSKLVFSGLTLK